MPKNALVMHWDLVADRGTFWQQMPRAAGAGRPLAVADEMPLDSFTNPAIADSGAAHAVVVRFAAVKGNLETHCVEAFTVVAADSVCAAFTFSAAGTLPEDSAGRHTAYWAERRATHILTLVVKTAASYR